MSATKTKVPFHKIDVPAISLHGDPRNLMEDQQSIRLSHIATQRATIRVWYTTFKASYSELPEYQKFLWEECEFLPTVDEDEMEEKKLREENQVMESTVKTLELTDQEFWIVSHINLTRVDCVTEEALASLLNPRPRIRTPSPMPSVEFEEYEEEPKHLEPPERGESEGLQPRTSRSRSRTPPTSAPSSTLHHRAPTRRSRSVVRGHMVTARLEHMRLQAEKLANTIGQETLDSAVISEAVRRANLRLRQENTSGAIDLDKEESHINRVATLIGYLLSQAQIGVAINL